MLAGAPLRTRSEQGRLDAHVAKPLEDLSGRTLTPGRGGCIA